MYSIKEIYYTLQGEGHHIGRAAVFLRFSGCNLWSGLEKDRSTAICKFCDTEFWGTDGLNGGKYDAQELTEKCVSLWPEESNEPPFIVCTGGEPLLQLDQKLTTELHKKGFYIAVESNGTLPIPEGVDWVCISPKAGAELKVKSGDELKIVYPQNGINLNEYQKLDFKYYSLQPLEDENIDDHTEQCLNACKENPKWRLSVQMHKIIGIP